MKQLVKPTLLTVLIAGVISGCSLAPRYQQPKVETAIYV